VKSIDEIGGVITGVNDGPAEGEAFDDAGSAAASGVGLIASAPLPAAMLADERAREAKYGAAPLTSTVAALDTRRPPHWLLISRQRPPAGGASSTRPKTLGSTRCSTRLRSELRQGRAADAIGGRRRQSRNAIGLAVLILGCAFGWIVLGIRRPSPSAALDWLGTDRL
jgi:hypothetical protein